jgi:SH3-like domain-containing protein
MADSAVPVAPAPTPEPLGTVAAQRRYASTWTNVRADRSNTAPVIRILRPGEVVQVDSLKQGWYRLVTDEQATGYVDQRYLDTLPPGPP